MLRSAREIHPIGCRVRDARRRAAVADNAIAFQISVGRGACHGHFSAFVPICLITYRERKPVADYSDLAGTTAMSSRVLGGSLTVRSRRSITLGCSLLDLGKSAVDTQFGAGDEAAVIRGQEQCGCRDLFRAAHPVQWYRRGKRRPDLVGFLR